MSYERGLSGANAARPLFFSGIVLKMSNAEAFDSTRFTFSLNTSSLGRNFQYVHETSSTMDLARKAAAEGTPHGTLILAEMQTAGRGRRGRDFFSPAGGSLYFTLVLRPPIGVYTRLPLAVPLAVCRACACEGVPARIKWPNDIWVGERKLGGMLIDGETGTAGFTAYVGIGINVNADPTADPGLRNIATSLSHEVSSEVVREDLLARICNELEMALTTSQGDLIKDYRELSLVLHRRIIVEEIDSSYEARVVEIASDGALVVEREDGERLTVLAADVSVRPKD
ncbi:MAG: biotin--[acetyl-CoA-carboxylase] ligase [Dehalococcoidia bacterium]|nr:biotin--[acetyl-CoA-carboxylase] ligase [Dehalococcoidia bacterium]